MSRTTIVVIVMNGCPACEQYDPVVRAAAARHPNIPVLFVDAMTKDANWKALMDRPDVDVSETPTTLVLRNPTGVIKAVGALDHATLEQLMMIAERYR